MNHQTYQYSGGYYGYEQNPFIPKDPFINREARHLTKLSLLAGAGVLGFVMMQHIFALLLQAAHLYTFYLENLMFQSVCGALISIVCVYVPFRLVSLFYAGREREKCMAFDKPVSGSAFWLAVGAGVMFCYVGDFVTGGFSGFVSAFGIELSDVDMGVPTNPAEFLMYALEIAVVPALVEEFAIRGVVMQPLRKYGDRFAIVMSALIFALMHGNMLQIPFAFVAGIALGYFAIATGSIWTSITIHFINNLLSAIITTANQNEAVGGFVFCYTVVIVFVLGVYCLLRFIKTPHFGLGLLRAPRRQKRTLLVTLLAFFALSFSYAMYGVFSAWLYPVLAVAALYAYKKYQQANTKMLHAAPVSSLSPKLRICLFCGTPTVLLGGYFLLSLTSQSITVTGSNGTIAYASMRLILLAAAVYAVYTVKKSEVIESKTAYTVSIVLLAAMVFFSLIGSAVSGMVQ